MRRGIFVPALAVRIAVGTVAVAFVAMAAASAPDAVRYFKMKTM
ncbi:hypothetical protein GCM10012287_11680 [Streptomyces daqingensis]|uniref:Uncharacterized protein n=1 Tax=Streptomyces daqingensis TaxID=1472640 RepID=A0ABQ2LZ56_9ACTN|nr:hypothetical protein [Streptomyces daqingensis]GGO44948.1 hypothetical protein GCM10012287_11680 [Streptomyces daqingensis]